MAHFAEISGSVSSGISGSVCTEIFIEPALLEKIAQLQAQVQTLEQQKQLLEKLGRESIAPADSQAKIMKSKEGFYPAYNVQSTVDIQNHMIAQMDVTD